MPLSTINRSETSNNLNESILNLSDLQPIFSRNFNLNAIVSLEIKFLFNGQISMSTYGRNTFRQIFILGMANRILLGATCISCFGPFHDLLVTQMRPSIFKFSDICFCGQKRPSKIHRMCFPNIFGTLYRIFFCSHM